MKQLKEKQIVITGMGLVDALGNSQDINFDNIINNNTNILNLLDLDIFKHAIQNNVQLPTYGFDFYKTDLLNDLKKYGLTNKDLRRLTPKTMYSIKSIYDALLDANINLNDEKNKNIPIIYSVSRYIDFILNLDKIINSNDPNKKENPFYISNSRPDFIGDFISIRHNLHGMSHSISATCTTGLYGVDSAIKSMIIDDSDLAIVGCGNFMLSPHEMFGFAQLGALNMSDGGLSMPFDKNRNGFLMGNGVGCLILESKERALRRNAKIYAEIVGLGLSCDGHHMTSPDSNSVGAKIALEKCLETFNDDNIDYINAHATSTPIGDEIEAKLMEKYFPRTSINSNKGHIGHCIFSSNILEIIYTILAMKHSLIPPTANLQNPLEANLDFVMHKPKEKKIKYALKNSFGFGGRNGFILLKNMML